MRLKKSIYLTCLILTSLVWSMQVANSSYTSQKPGVSDEPVKIGLLIPDNKSVAARHGAEMAILKANENGGFNGRSFQLIIRSMEGPWGTGSKEAVNLIFEENVWAIMGSHDGRNAHIVEQVSAKERIVFLNAWANDPTLSQAFVPWYFSCVPNDLQQASAFIDEIYNKRKIRKVALLSDNDYDSKMASGSFVKKAKITGKPEPLCFIYENSDKDFTEILDKINTAEIKCIILFGQPSASLKLIQQIRQRKMTQSVFGALSVQGETELPDNGLKILEGVALISSVDWLSTKSTAFEKEFQKIYGTKPGIVDAYAYDGMNVIIEAIRNAGLDREQIQKSLKKIHYDGVTGPIQFDDKGNREGVPGIIQITNGIPVDIGVY
jgi:branched-chain amino acid transport system substrate-binding protein